jgi:hypothetical protein
MSATPTHTTLATFAEPAAGVPAPAASNASAPVRPSLSTRLGKLTRHEFWPAWAFYLPAAPWVAWLALRHGPMTFTCCNPGIPCGGGLVGESKAQILGALADSAEWVLPHALIGPEGSPAERAERAAEAMRREPRLGAFPVIVKPDVGERGFGVRLARSPADLLAYFRTMTRAAVLQAYHPGPCECGILWARDPGSPPGSGRAGSIFSITRKEFPHITGDGRRTLEELVLAHTRYRFQADVFLARFAHDRRRVLAAGEALRLAVSGNHCQGTLFRDGADLIAPALEERIDAIARAFRGPDGGPGGLDFGRFDVRYESDEALRAGRGLAIIELNGTSSESTNMYDPSRPLGWAQGVLRRQWATLYRLGAARRRQGVAPTGLRALRAHYRAARDGRPACALAD